MPTFRERSRKKVFWVWAIAGISFVFMLWGIVNISQSLPGSFSRLAYEWMMYIGLLSFIVADIYGALSIRCPKCNKRMGFRIMNRDHCPSCGLSFNTDEDKDV